MSPEATAATAWEHARGVLDCSRGRLVGIVNANPDSFSDGGVSAGFDRAVAHGHALAAAGADVVEVGGESLQFARQSPVEVEIDRVVPVIARLRAELDVPVAVDTFKAPVAEAAIAAGAAIVNDPTGFWDPAMPGVVAAGGAGLVLTHFVPPYVPEEGARLDFGVPETGAASSRDLDVPAVVAAWARSRMAVAAEAGISEGRIVIDPGLGLGKSLEQDLDLLHRIDEVVALGRPVLVPISNKKLLGALTGRAAPDRLAGNAAGLAWCRARGASLFRVHDVEFLADVLRVTEALVEGRAARWFDVD